MRVALLTNFIPPYRKSLYRELDRRIENLTIFISQEMEKNRNWTVDHSGLNVILQKGIRYSKKWRGQFGYDERTVVQIPYDTFFRLRKFKPDIVLSSELGIRSLLSALYCRIYKKPLILWLALSEHTEKNKKGTRRVLRKTILRSASTIMCNGKSGERYIRSFGIETKVFFTPYTSDFDIRQPSHDKRSLNKTILFTGQLIKRKGIDEMVRAFLSWSEKNKTKTVNLLVAGDGPEKAVLMQLDRIPNIELELLGTVAYDKLQELYRNSDIYLFPTLADEWGVVVNEAMASGVPVLGSGYSQAVEELITDEENGWIFFPDVPHTFLQALSNAINTPSDKLKEMGDKGCQIISQYTPENIAENIQEAIFFTHQLNEEKQ